MELSTLKDKAQKWALWERLTSQRIKEALLLVWTNVTFTCSSILEYLRVCSRYYSNKQFFKTDLAIRLMYLFNHPFSISKRFLRQRGDADLYTYGETPLTTMEAITRTCNVTAADRFYDLGCGRGHLCFWVNACIGCSVVGIEEIPEFIERGNRIKERVGATTITFKEGNYLATDLSDATLIYLYGSNLTDATICDLAAKLRHLPKGTRIITVSFPLSDYSTPDTFVTLKRFSAPFPWGEADVYLQVV